MISLHYPGYYLLYAIISYNTLTRKRNNVDNAFGLIDAVEKRSDLIPKFSRYCTAIREHEEETFAKIKFTDEELRLLQLKKNRFWPKHSRLP